MLKRFGGGRVELRRVELEDEGGDLVQVIVRQLWPHLELWAVTLPRRSQGDKVKVEDMSKGERNKRQESNFCRPPLYLSASCKLPFLTFAISALVP